MAKLNINKPKVLTAVAGFVLAAMHITLFLGVADGMMNLVNTVKFLAALVMAGAALNVAFSVKDSNRPMFIAAAASSVMFGISYLASAAAFYNTYLRLWSETALSLGIVELIVDFCMFLALVLIGICMILDFGLASKADGIIAYNSVAPVPCGADGRMERSVQYKCDRNLGVVLQFDGRACKFEGFESGGHVLH